jgi:putative membrane protein
MKTQLITLAVAAMASSLALAQSARDPAGTGNMSGKSSSVDASFIKKLAEGDLAEVDAGRLASRKAENQGVKNFGQEMVTDHSKNDTELKSVAAANGMEAPATLDHEHAAEKARLESASGSAFDKQYIDAQVRDHEKTVQLLQHEISHGQDPAVKDFAQKTLQVVKHHLAMARELQASLGGSGTTRGGTR